jgi:hypothetical protein
MGRIIGGGVRGRSERMTSRRGWWLTLALTITATGLTACGGDEDGGDGTGSPRAETAVPSPSEKSHEPILIKTRVARSAGEVLAGSVIGGSPFCRGGTLRHEHGSPEIGFPAIDVFDCPDGQLKIGFGPGPDQMNKRIQTSYWEILDGSGRFADMRGDGQMKVRFERVGSSKGLETFRGEVIVP